MHVTNSPFSDKTLCSCVEIGHADSNHVYVPDGSLGQVLRWVNVAYFSRAQASKCKNHFVQHILKTKTQNSPKTVSCMPLDNEQKSIESINIFTSIH